MTLNDAIYCSKNTIYQAWNQAFRELSKIKGQWYRNNTERPYQKLWFRHIKYTKPKDVTTIIQLRTSHCQSPTHLHKIYTTPNCTCGPIPETINHRSFQCINNKTSIDIFLDIVSSLQQNIIGPLQ